MTISARIIVNYVKDEPSKRLTHISENQTVFNTPCVTENHRPKIQRKTSVVKLSPEKKRVEGTASAQATDKSKKFFKSRECQNDFNHSKIYFPVGFYLKEDPQEVFL